MTIQPSPPPDWPEPRDVLPHRGRMCLLSRITAIDSHALEAEIDVSEASTLCEPGRGVPRWVALEYLAQTVAALDGCRRRGAGEPVQAGYLLGTRRLDGIDGYFAPGQRLAVRVEELLQDAEGLGVFACTLRESGREPIEAQLSVYRPATPLAPHSPRPSQDAHRDAAR